MFSNNLISSKGIELDSGNGYITAYPMDSGVKNTLYGVRIYGASSTGGLAITVGSLSGTPNFSVDTAGVLTATNAIISGTVTASNFVIDDANYWNNKTNEGNFRIGTPLNSTSPSYLSYTGTDGLIVQGKITATSGYIGSSTNGWVIQSSYLSSKSTTSTKYLKLDATTDSVISYSPAASALGSLVTFSAE
jgi:hypothetical protein